MTTYGIQETPWGRLGLEVNAHGVSRVIFDAPAGMPMTGVWADVLTEYIAGHPIPIDLPVAIAELPDFTQRVLVACRQIPFGCTMSYGQLANSLGNSAAVRAVGQALARNPVPVIIPCHRVVGANGQLTGFAGGLDWKRKLLLHEGVPIIQNRVQVLPNNHITVRSIL